MDNKSKEQFPGPNPEMGVGGDAVAEFERRNAIERLEGLIEALSGQTSSLHEVAGLLRAVANQLDFEQIALAFQEQPEEAESEPCMCDDGYVCYLHDGSGWY